jgi:hypothetical protein
VSAPPAYPSSLVSPITEDEEADNEMNVREWEAYKAVAIRTGKDIARNRGGRPFKVEMKKKVPAVFVAGKA